MPVNTIQSATGGGIINTGLAQQSNIQFKKVALQLEVVPLINSEKEVSLEILQKLDSVADSVTVDGNQIPTMPPLYPNECFGAKRFDNCLGRVDDR